MFESAPDDLHLQARSPVIDKGDNSAPDLPATDKDGETRIQDGDGNGSAIVDMGAYEYPESLVFTPPNTDGLYVGYGGDLHVYVQRYTNGSMLLLYTFDTQNMAVFSQSNFFGTIFYGKPVNPNLNEEVEMDFINNTLTILKPGTAKAHIYNLTKIEDASPSYKDGIYKGANSSIDLNIYIQRYKNGGTLLIYTFDTETMVASWDNKVENNQFEGTIVNPAILEVANFDFNTNTLTIYHTDTGISESYDTKVFEKALVQ